MIIDLHAHFGEDKPRSVTIPFLQRIMKENSVDKIALFPFGSQDLIESSKNILNLSKEYDWIIPFLRFNPKTITEPELRSLLEMGFKGVKLHPASENFDTLDESFSWIFGVTTFFRVPIIFHCKSYYFDENSHPYKLLGLAKKFPKQVFIFGHFAGVNKKLFKEYAHFPNIYVETSIDVTPNAYREVVDYGFNRLIFGSDIPFSFPDIELLKLKKANFDEKIMEDILYKNALKALDFVIE